MPSFCLGFAPARVYSTLIDGATAAQAEDAISPQEAGCMATLSSCAIQIRLIIGYRVMIANRRYTNMFIKKILLFTVVMLFTASAFAEPYHHHRRHHHYHHYHHHHSVAVVVH